MLRTLVLAALLWACPAMAHEAYPAYLSIEETSEGRYDIVWRVPAPAGIRLPVEVRMPEACRIRTPMGRTQFGEVMIDRFSVECLGGLRGRDITFSGLEETTTDVIVYFRPIEGPPTTIRIRPRDSRLTISGGGQSAAGGFFLLGIQHILSGADHLLFVFGLLFIVRGRWMLLKTITAFTIAHSLTLAAAVLGPVRPASGPIEALIALSILFLGVEIVRTARGRATLTVRRPWLVAFAFGLLHGFGFAGALSALGLPANQIPHALLAFNIGVEIGQIAFIAPLLLAGVALAKIPRPAWTRIVPAYLVGSLGAAWTIQRVLMLFGV